ncbi:MAG: glycosyltransferase family 1 protein [Bacteroidetes bacterium]|nr:MAG: glycosyltransferase family 1 protein [Bacteroidota bacterium]
MTELRGSSMKILQATYVRGVAGSENFLLNAISGLKAKGHQVEMLILYVDQQETEAFKKLLDERAIKHHSFDIKGFSLLKSLKGIAKLCRHFDLINSHLLHADLTLSLAKRFFHRKMILVSGKHGYEEWYINKFGFDPKHKTKNKYWYISRLAEKNTNRSFAISKGIQNLFIGADISPTNAIDLIYYGFEFDNQFKNDPNLRFGPQQLCIVGRLTAFKGHRFAIESVEILKDEFPEIKLVLVGWGELEQELKQMVQDKGLEDNVIFTGFQKNARDYMASSDIILLPSISEGFGIVLAEAMSVKRPIIAFDVPSPSELLENNISGVLVPPYDVPKYATAIRSLLLAPEHQQKLAEKAYEMLQDKYHLSRMIRQLEEFYLRAITIERG